MSKSLPSRPSLEQLKKQAKELLQSHRFSDAAALARLRENHPRFKNLPDAGLAKVKFTLTDAQLVIAREYGFTNWTKLKAHLDTLLLDSGDPVDLLRRALAEDDAEFARKLLERHPALRAKINEPIASFDSPAIIQARSPKMLDTLLAADADLNAKSKWWAGGFGLLHGAAPALAAYAIARGAVVDIHAAARLGMLDRLRELLAADPRLVHARGGDGQTPLHFAANVEAATILLGHGADIDARDLDHESTPAQHMVRDRLAVAAFLVSRGCKADLLLAAALGDLPLAERLLAENPEALRLRVGHECFPMANPHAGGTIYQWTLGWHVSAFEVARSFGHPRVLQWLTERAPLELKLVAAAWAGDRPAMKRLLAQDPALLAKLTKGDRRQLAHAARNNNLPAVRAMLEAGWPLDATSQHGATALHWAAFHGNAPMVREILRRGPSLECTDADFHGRPLGWALHGSQHGWSPGEGDYAATVEILCQAGAVIPPGEPEKGTPAARAALKKMQEKLRA